MDMDLCASAPRRMAQVWATVMPLGRTVKPVDEALDATADAV